ncbi:tyrosine-protein phosphatase non-receptor type, putative [Pediculus humanus corporis]|uniref:Tyrosine-protein phosphatase non-receptor type 9 n=1 Tax=Pediculus humanus subsp. corporis TaxID=121224 RepID=E0VJD3_PEDHC|nr:tyrosine-protein phosphatase non-receptor type, putative [Pediculus humanus corporis]EEB13489.1 tyrosine-protein phosphatase non-receptor type, putative [Pediculus humanus corporis]
MSQVLTEEQEQAAKHFIEVVNKLKKHRCSSPLSWSCAIKFLAARKYDVQRAVTLYEQHELTRHREGLVYFDTNAEPLKSELNTGKFTILPGRDASGAAVALFRAHMHHPSLSSHQTTLQGVVYQLDVALDSPETQKNGLVFIYDMSDSKYSNFDYDFSQKILPLLKGGYPAKLKKVLIVTAPLWFKAPFKILRLFVREKLRDRVFTISIPQLPIHIPRESLPTILGGTLEIDHDAWLRHCRLSTSSINRQNESLDKTTTNLYQEINNLDKKIMLMKDSNEDYSVEKKNEPSPEKHPRLSHYSNSGEEHDEEISKTLDAINWNRRESNSGCNSSTPPPPSSASSGFSDDDSLHCDVNSPSFSIEQFVDHVRLKGRKGLMAEYSEIREKPPDGSFNIARMKQNLVKNRYTDVLCYDHSRVLLSQQSNDPNSDYINANYVDGYKQKNAFISTQGPLPKTAPDFWRMVWEQNCLVIVMTTKVMERGKTKCYQYWEPQEGGTVHGNFTVRTLSIDLFTDFTVYRLELVNLKSEEVREIYHFQFTSWPDYGTPHSALAMLDFLERVRLQQANMVALLGDTWAGHPRGPPIVVHCSAGIGRTGTFCTIDICISRLQDVGTVDSISPNWK